MHTQPYIVYGKEKEYTTILVIIISESKDFLVCIFFCFTFSSMSVCNFYNENKN